MHRRLILFSLILVIVLHTIPLKAQESPPESAVSNKITLNFDDEDVFAVIQTIFGDILRVNYIIDPQVKGRVNLRTVAPVSKDEILPLMEVILRLNGISVVEENNLYRIVPLSAVSKEPTAVGIGNEAEKVRITGKALLQVVPVNYISSSEMVKILTPFLSANSVIVDVSKSNHIIVVDTDANVKRLLQLVEIFDSERLKRIKPDVFVYPVQNSKARDVAALLQQIFLGARPPAPAVPAAQEKYPATPSSQAAQPVQQPKAPAAVSSGGGTLVSDITTIFPDEITNTVIVLSTPEDYTLIAETIKKIDIVPRQVLIEGLIARIRLTDELRFGIAWSVKEVEIKPFDSRGYDLDINNIPGNISLTADQVAGFSVFGIDTEGKIRAKLEALATEGKGTVMAAPHILVSDNREARIQVGQQIPIVTSETKPAAGTDIIRTVQYKDIGIILSVKPQVNDSGLVSLEISQEISSVAASAIGGEVAIDKTETMTNLVAQDGQTIIIGGLIREDTTKAREGIPFLSRLPILGPLFSSNNRIGDRTELIILLTPHVIRNRAEASNVTSDYLDKFKDATKDEKINEFIREKSGNGSDENTEDRE
ncbi:MAG: hypothetical protein C4526_00710 [Nitrospiraceae bacterium]|nr:MAG: hypothetical protein C4526_00710 [Nitrospiraceae bacterium]